MAGFRVFAGSGEKGKLVIRAFGRRVPNMARLKHARVNYLSAAFTLLLSVSAFAQNKPLTARQVIEHIKAQIGVPWKSDTVDTFKAGDPDAAVTGIAVTMMATLDVLQRAAASGDKLIITHEPTFYDHLDISDQLPEKDIDPVLAA